MICLGSSGAERFHGKEEVVGSIPTPGSIIFSIGTSFNGRTAVSKTADVGSIPPVPAIIWHNIKITDYL